MPSIMFLQVFSSYIYYTLELEKKELKMSNWVVGLGGVGEFYLIVN